MTASPLPDQPSGLNEIQRRGRFTLVAILTLYLVIYVYFGLHHLATAGIGAAYQDLIRTLVVAALFYAIWDGYPWARWLTVALIFIIALPLIGPALRSFHPVLLTTVLLMVVPGLLLAFSKSITAFLLFQWERRIRK